MTKTRSTSIGQPQGIVSRIDETLYPHSYKRYLSIQIDAASLNRGNSGGPAFDRQGKIVGIAIQSMSNAAGIGYLVPTEVIHHFFDDIKDGKYDGYPDDGILVQSLENKYMQNYYHLMGEDLKLKILRDG